MPNPHNESMYTQIGLELSLYSGKTRSYLLHKKIPFVERGSNPWEFTHTIPRRTRAAAVPVIITPEGEWLQDTSAIIDELERRFPARPALPSTPILRFASYLFELWGDEFWLPLAMHARWSHAENLPLFLHDIGTNLVSTFPRWVQNLVGQHYAKLMRDHLPHLGINPQSAPLIDRFAQIQLDGLNDHFAEHRFLFGDRPSLGDYGLIAPLYAHLGRDPWPKRELIGPRPHLKAWIERMFQPSPTPGQLQGDDRIPETLNPALRSIFDEMIPFVAKCASELRNTPLMLEDCRKGIRFLPEVSHPMAGGTYHRQAMSYVVWMAQRMLDAFRETSGRDQVIVTDWLRSVGGESVLQLDLPRVKRIGLAAVRIA